MNERCPVSVKIVPNYPTSTKVAPISAEWRARAARSLSLVGVALCFGAALPSCVNRAERDIEAQKASSSLNASASVRDLMKARGLREADVEAALKTYVPTGKRDDYVIFASGGQSGQILVIGVPSMRLLKVSPLWSA